MHTETCVRSVTFTYVTFTHFCLCSLWIHLSATEHQEEDSKEKEDVEEEEEKEEEEEEEEEKDL